MNVERTKAEGGRRKAEGRFRTPPSPFHLPPSRSALTLIELLIVVIILTTLVAAAIPILSPAGDDRRLREAARGLNTYITGAQARAISSRRPFGIALKRLSQDTGRADDNGVCLELFYVEQPAPYAGFDANSRARIAQYTPASKNPPLYNGVRPLVLIQFVTRGIGVATNQDGLPPGWDADLFPDGMIRAGDVIEIGGTQYRLLADDRDSDVTPRYATGGVFFASDTGKPGNNNKTTQIVAQPLNNTGQVIHVAYDDRGNAIGTAQTSYPPFFTSPATYKILRQPALASDQPYQLPEGAAIDLRASGIEFDPLATGGFFQEPEKLALDLNVGIDNSEPVVIMFSPEGTVSRLRFSEKPSTNSEAGIYDEAITSNVFLLVGKRENIPAADIIRNNSADKTLDIATCSAATEPQFADLRQPINWLRGESRWVVIGSQSGRIATIENAFVNLHGWATGSDAAATAYQNPSWLVRRRLQIQAAREFTSEMRQVGGR